MTGYVRKDTTNNIADGNVINAADLDSEFDGVQDAFNASTGHKHDGTAGEGATINALGPTQDVTVSSTLLAPKTTNTVDIGSSALKFKDLFLAGNASVGGTLAVTGVATFTAQPILSSLTASRAVFSDGSKGLVSNAITGTGNVVMSASPTLTGTAGLENITASGTLGVTGVATFTAQPIVSSLTASRAVFSDGSKGLVSNAITGTGNVVMSASPTLTGTIAAEALTASSTVTLSGGTANGVAYLNGSKVLTSGSALTFDGTNLGVGTTPSFPLHVNATGNGTKARFTNGTTTLDLYCGGTEVYTGTTGASTSWAYATANTYIAGYVNGTEGLRLTSTSLYTASGINVGIGTSSPAQSLHVKTSTSATPITLGVLSNATGLPALSFNGAYASSTMAGIYANGATSTSLYYEVPSGNSHFWGIADSTKMTLDSAGNLGLGVTPSAWNSTTKAIQVGDYGCFSWNGYEGGTVVGNNVYQSASTTEKYIATGVAPTKYRLSGGSHAWYTAASGTAGNAISFTQAATLTADGDFLVGTTTAFARLSVIVPNGADRNLIQAGVTSATNGLTVKWNNATSTIRMNIQNLPTSATGLASGDLYVLAGALMVA